MTKQTEQHKQGHGKDGQGDARPAKSKVKNNLMNYTRQLTTLGALQNTIILNLQKEIENV